MATKYSVTYHGPSGKITTSEIEATDMGMIDGHDGNHLVVWTRGKRHVFAVPYRFFLHTTVINSPVAAKVVNPKTARIIALRAV